MNAAKLALAVAVVVAAKSLSGVMVKAGHKVAAAADPAVNPAAASHMKDLDHKVVDPNLRKDKYQLVTKKAA